MLHAPPLRLTGTRRIAWWILLIVGSAVFVAHFAAVQMMNMPMNPVKLALYAPLDGYVNPYFSQNWSFFAPNPVSDDLSTMIRGESADSSGRMHVTPWFDVSDTLIETAKGSPLSPIASISLALSNATVQFVNHANDDKTASFDAHGQHYLRSRFKMSVDSMDATIMTTIATSMLETQYPSVHFSHVQIGVRAYVFPRFTQRTASDDPAKGTLIQFNWQKAPAVVPLRS